MELMKIDTEFITLGQLLKMANCISSGGMAKWYLEENTVYVNGEVDRRRGRKLYDGDIITLPGAGKFKISASPNGQSNVH